MTDSTIDQTTSQLSDAREVVDPATGMAAIDAAARALILGAAAAGTTVINLHALQAMPASLLNRDQLGAQKTITVGDVVRERISSQSWKRAIRTWIRAQAVEGGAFALRSNRWPATTAGVLVAEHGLDADVAAAKVRAVFSALGFKVTDKGTTAASIYAHQSTAAVIAGVIAQQVEEIGDKVPEDVVDAARVALDPANAVDLALFGRMLAEQPIGGKIDGAVSVGHPTAVGAAAIIEDFFTAVDDLAPEGEAVSGNLGTSDLSAPVLYRTASIDLAQLRRNLAGAEDPEALTRAAVAVAIEGFVTAVPSAKQRSTNAGTRPSVVVASVGKERLTADNAFTSPVRGADVVGSATAALFEQLAYQARFGAPQRTIALAGDRAADTNLPDPDGFAVPLTIVSSLSELIEQVLP